MQGGDTGTAVPKLAVFDLEDCLRGKLHKLDSVLCSIREELLGAKAAGEEAKEPDSVSGFFSEIQCRLRRDIKIVDEVTVVANDVQRSFGNLESVKPEVR